eukprot:PRCOL_00006114-RA
MASVGGGGSFAERLAAAERLSDQRARADAYKAALDDALATAAAGGGPADLERFAAAVLADSVDAVTSRAMCGALVQGITTAGLPADAHKVAAEATLALLAPRAVSFLAETNSLRQQLSSLLEAEEEWSRAAAVLSGIDLDSGTTDANRERREADKLRTEVHIARLYLEDDDPAQAEAHVRRAAALVAGSADELLQLQYSTCHARVLDAQRRFLEASLAYYAVSKKVSVTDGDGNRLEQDEAEQQTALTQATTCAILAPAGPQRSRILATLYKDERCAKLPSYALLEKVHLERMLRPAEVESFTQTLRPHQMAVRGDGTRVHERAVVEHNLLAASTLYTNISFGELGSLLGTTAEAAESIAARMVIEDRMRASIDQVDGYIHFMPDVEELSLWDAQIQDVCAAVNDVLDEAVAKGLVGDDSVAMA